MSQYWVNRNKELERIKMQFNSDADYNRELARIYSRAQREIDKEIQSELMRFASREQLSMAEAQQRVSKMDVEAFRDKAKRYAKEKNFSPRANQELRAYNTRMRMSRLELLNHNIHLETVALADEENKLLTARLTDEAVEEYTRQAGILGETVPDNLRRMTRQLVVAEFQGTTFSERIWQNQKELQQGLERTLRRTIIRGENPRVAGRELRKLVGEEFFGKYGTSGAKYAAERIAITESARVQTETQKASYEEYGITQMEWVAEPDACPDCGGMDGKVFGVRDADAQIPLHPFCRCTFVPYVDRNAWENDLKERGLLSPSSGDSVAPFVEANSIKQANDYATSVLGIPEANYKGVDVQTANAWNKGVKETLERFPALKDKFRFIGEAHERNNSLKRKLRADILPRTLKANPNAPEKAVRSHVTKYVNQMTKNLKVSRGTMAQSWTPKNDIFKDYGGITVNRDIGKDAGAFTRSLQRQVEMKFHPEGTDTIKAVLDHEVGHQLDDLLGIGNKKEIQKLYDSRTREDITEDLSRYAWDNNNRDRYSEMIAEGWSEYKNNPNPREIARTIGEMIEREYDSRFN